MVAFAQLVFTAMVIMTCIFNAPNMVQLVTMRDGKSKGCRELKLSILSDLKANRVIAVSVVMNVLVVLENPPLIIPQNSLSIRMVISGR
jgi:hypothetical protein